MKDGRGWEGEGSGGFQGPIKNEHYRLIDYNNKNVRFLEDTGDAQGEEQNSTAIGNSSSYVM